MVWPMEYRSMIWPREKPSPLAEVGLPAIAFLRNFERVKGQQDKEDWWRKIRKKTNSIRNKMPQSTLVGKWPSSVIFDNVLQSAPIIFNATRYKRPLPVMKCLVGAFSTERIMSKQGATYHTIISERFNI